MSGTRTDDLIYRGSEADRDRWLAELEAAEIAESFPAGGSLILAESPEHAVQIVDEMTAGGHRAIVCGAYVRTTCDMRKEA